MSGKYLLGNMLSALYNKNCFYDNPIKVVYSKICEDVLKSMKKNGYIKDYIVFEEDGKKSINVWLRVVNNNKNLTSFKLVSKPGRRVYLSARELKKKRSYNPFVLLLVSTSKGVLEINDAVKDNIGGEVLCEIF